MIKESTIQNALDRGDLGAVRSGLRRAALTLIKKDGLFPELRGKQFTDMDVRVPLVSFNGNVQVSFRTSGNPYSDPGTFFNSYTKRDETVVRNIPKKKLIRWGE